MKEDILTKIPDIDYSEVAPEIDCKEFDKVITSRRSVRVYTEEKVPEEVMKKTLHHATLAPNSSNLQSWKFVWVKSKEAKKKCVRACLGQSAARTASELIIVLADTKGWKNIQPQMLEKLKADDAPRGAISYYKSIVPLAYGQGPLGVKGLIKKFVIFFRGFSKPTPRGPTSQNDMKVWANKTAALACENIMLSLRAQGYDSCPMEGFDEKLILDLVRESQPTDGLSVCMVISAGKRASNGIYGPQIRMDSTQFITEI
jgi:nitroreductase